MNPRSTSRRRSSQAVAIGAVTALAVTLTGCGSSEEEQSTDAEYAQICVDEKTQERVEDSQCEDTSHSHSNFGWMWLPFFLNSQRTQANTIPPVGSRVEDSQRPLRTPPYQGRETSGSNGSSPRSGSATRVPASGATPSASEDGKTTLKSPKSGTSRGGFGKKGGGSGS